MNRFRVSYLIAVPVLCFATSGILFGQSLNLPDVGPSSSTEIRAQLLPGTMPLGSFADIHAAAAGDDACCSPGPCEVLDPSKAKCKNFGKRQAPAPALKEGWATEGRVADSRFWMLTTALYGSSIANAELAARCIDQNSCTSIKDPFRSRIAMYGVGLPVDSAIAWWTYRLKARGHRWWFVPAVALTAANSVVAWHWTTRMR